MAKLTDINVVEFFDNDNIHFKTPVSVSKEGVFTTTLPESAVNLLKEYGLKMDSNRLGREGYFENKTLAGLENEIHEFVRDCISRTLIEDKLVIKYRIRTKAAYLVDVDGEIIPNGYWVKNHKDFEEQRVVWRDGNANSGMNRFTPSLSVFASVYHKKTYSYKSGKTVTLYEKYDTDSKGRSHIDWLASQVNLAPDDKMFGFTIERDIYPLPEIEATPEVADLFVKLVKFIDQANELFQGLNNPENILALLAANTPKKLEF